MSVVTGTWSEGFSHPARPGGSSSPQAGFSAAGSPRHGRAAGPVARRPIAGAIAPPGIKPLRLGREVARAVDPIEAGAQRLHRLHLHRRVGHHVEELLRDQTSFSSGAMFRSPTNTIGSDAAWPLRTSPASLPGNRACGGTSRSFWGPECRRPRARRNSAPRSRPWSAQPHAARPACRTSPGAAVLHRHAGDDGDPVVALHPLDDLMGIAGLGEGVGGKLVGVALVSCRHSTSGWRSSRSFSASGRRSRTELMFQVVMRMAAALRCQTSVKVRVVSPSTLPTSVFPLTTAATPSGVPVKMSRPAPAPLARTGTRSSPEPTRSDG